ncbi:MAG: hypothetical protein AB7K37_11535 [Cyclobacteriaceae bacterium]
MTSVTLEVLIFVSIDLQLFSPTNRHGMAFNVKYDSVCIGVRSQLLPFTVIPSNPPKAEGGGISRDQRKVSDTSSASAVTGVRHLRAAVAGNAAFGVAIKKYWRRG